MSNIALKPATTMTNFIINVDWAWRVTCGVLHALLWGETVMLNEAKLPRPRTRLRLETWGQVRGRGQLFKAEAKTGARICLRDHFGRENLTSLDGKQALRCVGRAKWMGDDRCLSSLTSFIVQDRIPHATQPSMTDCLSPYMSITWTSVLPFASSPDIIPL